MNKILTLLVIVVVVAAIAVALAVGLGVLPSGSGDTSTSTTASSGSEPGQGMPAPGAPLSVEQALAAAAKDDSQPFLVTGYLFVYAGGDAKLCDAILESYPPQPGGATLLVEGLDEGRYEFTTEGDVSWTDVQVQVLGTIDPDAATLTVTPNSI